MIFRGFGKILILVFLNVSLISCTHKYEHKYHDYMNFEQARRVINELFVATDNKNWGKVRSLFAPKVNFDMTSLAGGEPSVMTPQQITTAWDMGLREIEQVHHQAGNFLFEKTDKGIEVFCYATATHYQSDKKPKLIVFVGSYEFRVSKHNSTWIIDKFKFNKKYITNY